MYVYPISIPDTLDLSIKDPITVLVIPSPGRPVLVRLQGHRGHPLLQLREGELQVLG